jgi:hypothetical protein
MLLQSTTFRPHFEFFSWPLQKQERGRRKVIVSGRTGFCFAKAGPWRQKSDRGRAGQGSVSENRTLSAEKRSWLHNSGFCSEKGDHFPPVWFLAGCDRIKPFAVSRLRMHCRGLSPILDTSGDIHRHLHKMPRDRESGRMSLDPYWRGWN